MSASINGIYNFLVTRVGELRSGAANRSPECVVSMLAAGASFYARLRTSIVPSLLARAAAHPVRTGALGMGAVCAVGLLILGPRVFREWMRDPLNKALDVWIDAAPDGGEKRARNSVAGRLRMFNIENSRVLSLQGLGASSLPSQISSFLSIKYLDLTSNLFKTVPSEIYALTNLKSLSLSANELKEFPEQITQLTKLKNIQLAFNQLKALPDNLGELKDLEWIDLRGNLFEEIPQIGNAETQIEIDILDLNRFPEEPEDIKVLPIHLVGNYVFICKERDAYVQFIAGLQAWIKEKVHGTEQNANRCKAARLMAECYKQVTDLHQYRSGRYDFEKKSPQYRDLNVELNLSNLGLTSLPSVFNRLRGLWFQTGAKLYGVATLRLDGNRFTAIPKEVLELEGLQYLWLWDNPIEHLPEDLPKKLPRLLLIHVCPKHLESAIPQSFIDVEIIHTKPSLSHAEWNKFSAGRKVVFSVKSL